MDREKKEKIAVFRFGVIFPLVEKDLHQYWGEKERILRELVSKEWEIPFSTRTYISKATILAWVKRYEDGGRKIEALFPERRGDKGRMRSITDEQIDALMQLRNEHPKLSTPRLVEIAQGNGVFPAGKEVSMASIYRLMKIRKAQRVKVESDMRKFEVQMPNDLWQSDCMHGPKVLHGGKLRKTYLSAIIDDHSRLIAHGQFYLAETLENYLDCLWTALRKRESPESSMSITEHHLRRTGSNWDVLPLKSGCAMPDPTAPRERAKLNGSFAPFAVSFSRAG
jgi:putative transposase